MVNKGLLDSPVFSFRVGSSEEDGGEAIFGGIDETAHRGSIHYVPVRRKAYWEVELPKISFGNDELELENTGAAIDTGTSLYCLLGSALTHFPKAPPSLPSLPISLRC
jgi:saccharopepsin